MPFTTIDVVAHEFTHGVTYSTALLGLTGQSGALDESFSDVFGTATEFYSRQLSNVTIPTLNPVYLANRPSANYLIGEEMGQVIRSLENPPSITSLVDSTPPVNVVHADHYNNRYTGSGNLGGRHVNAGIQNKVFYLLSVGGTHYGITVSAIGREKAERIFYRTLTTKLTSSSNFSSARTGSIASANELYGNGSFESNQVTAAWNSVGVP